ncbi:ribonuclease H-like domain-containing protein [Sporolactobacillus pectinivorans]|uniref:ribonuclease H-like domain-containing protein n=1 Tax=Sporolactobacillus pectinivorans TaxID=1591408 RepID=UPI000C26B9AB|nr:ribonuclease H-like domain-containing protein [Sporolactobacillus pectinivorans]
MSLKQKLQLYKKQLHQAQQIERGNKSEERAIHAADDEREIRRAAKDLDAEICRFEGQYVLVHTEQLNATTCVGPYTVKELFPVVADWQKKVSRLHPLSAYGLEAEDLLFFDTETTGLSAGAGEMIFLIGLARVTRSGVELKQYFLPGPGHEAAFYNAFLSDSRSLKNLVTFNGKAFDWPRVKTRYQFVRDQVPRLPAFGHFDLLHASRRLWKERLDSVRLQTVEKEILSMGRTDDIPGKMAPFLYFQFLKHPQASQVAGIIEHNREDVLSLIALYIHLSNKVLGNIDCDPAERYEIARWHQQIGDKRRAVSLFRTVADQNGYYGNLSKIHLAQLYKREGHYTHALTLMQSAISSETEPDDSLYIEAAKIMEHQFKDYREAIQYTQYAIDCLKDRRDITESRSSEKIRAYLKRLNRLDQKLLKGMDP